MKLNKEYKEIASEILDDEHFSLLKQDVHHGTNKYDHCKRVSYLSFLVSKWLKEDYKEAARAGLLHDFFFGCRTDKEENSYLNHPITSAKNAKEYFDINNNEINIIESHMYHHALVKRLNPFMKEEEKKYLKNYKPKNKNSVIVCVSDLLVSIYEVLTFKIRYNTCLYILFLINMMVK